VVKEALPKTAGEGGRRRLRPVGFENSYTENAKLGNTQRAKYPESCGIKLKGMHIQQLYPLLVRKEYGAANATRQRGVGRW